MHAAVQVASLWEKNCFASACEGTACEGAACEDTACEGAACEGTCSVPSPNIMFCMLVYVFHIHVPWAAGRWVDGFGFWWVGGLLGWGVSGGARVLQWRHYTIDEYVQPAKSQFP